MKTRVELAIVGSLEVFDGWVSPDAVFKNWYHLPCLRPMQHQFCHEDGVGAVQTSPWEHTVVSPPPCQERFAECHDLTWRYWDSSGHDVSEPHANRNPGAGVETKGITSLYTDIRFQPAPPDYMRSAHQSLSGPCSGDRAEIPLPGEWL
jgi:hypothetical protein